MITKKTLKALVLTASLITVQTTGATTLAFPGLSWLSWYVF